MTAVSSPTRPRPIPWRRMTWVTWRQHRVTLAAVAGLLAAAAAYALVTGLRLHHGYAAVARCHPAGSDVCRRVANDFLNAYGAGAQLAAALLQLVPALIGVFAGAPLLARELETGTFRFAWTQGFGRVRWTVAKLTTLAVAATAAAGACSVLFSWSFRPIVSTGSYGYSPLYPTLFDLRGVTFAAWTLAAFAIGACAGVLVRRAIPAMFVTLAAWVALAFATGAYLRRHYEAPVVTTRINVAPPDWVLSETLTHGGKPAGLAALNETLVPVGVRAVTPSLFTPVPGPATPDDFDPIRYLVHHGFSQVTVYQPAGRFWPFQWLEASWLLALSLLLLATTVWLVRHRAT
jgi:hypothetical protein